MALNISKDSELTDIVSSDGSNPITTQHPIEGSSVNVHLWLFNDNPTKRYVNVSISAIDTTDTDESDWIRLALDNNGSPDQFLSPNEALEMEDINDTLGKPFWVRVTTPAVSDTQNKSDIKLQISATEFAV